MSLPGITCLFSPAGREKQSFSEVMRTVFPFYVLKNCMAIGNTVSMWKIFFFQVLCNTFNFSCCSGWQFLWLMSNHDYHWIISQLPCTALFHKSSRWLEESFSVLYFDFIDEKRGAPLFNTGHWYCDFQHASVSFWDWSIFALIPSANTCCAYVRSLSCGLYLNLARYYQLFYSVLQLLTVLLAWAKYLGC